MIKSYTLDFCTLEIHDDYVLAVMNEGITVDKQNNAVLIEIAESHFDTPFVYITHRIHSYSVDPIVYIRTAQIEHLKGFAVVSKDPVQKTQTTYEKTFFDKEFKHFETMEDALKWKNKLLKKG